MAAPKKSTRKVNEAAPAAEAEAVQDQAPAADIVIAEVVEKFRDKESGSVLKAGVMVAVPPARFEELEEAGVAKRVDP